MNTQKNYGVDDWHKAVFGGPNAFGHDYKKFLEARFPGDEKSQEKFLQNSKEGSDYYNQLDNTIQSIGLEGDIFNLIDDINIKVIELVKCINIYVK